MTKPRKYKRGPRGKASSKPATGTRARKTAAPPPEPAPHGDSAPYGTLPEWTIDGDEHWYADGDTPNDPMIYLWRVYGRCTAKSKQSTRRCRKLPIPGGTVCPMHGGKAPQVKRLAEERIRALQLPAIHNMAYWIQQREYPATAASMINSVLDRTGLEAASKTKHSGKILTGPGDSQEQKDMRQRYEDLIKELKQR